MKQNKLGYVHGSVVNIYIVYELKNRTINNPDFTVANGWFGAVKIIKDTETSNYKYSGYGICFDVSFSSHERNRQNEIYVLGKDFI